MAPSEQADDGHRGAGRPPGGWRVTGAALSDTHGNYDTFALDLLADLAERDGTEAVDRQSPNVPSINAFDR